MFSPSELAEMTATIAETIGAGSGLGVSLELQRGAQALAAQAARIVRPGGQGRTASADGTEAAQTTVEVVGLPEMDIRARDRFAVAGQAYEVIAVQPQRQIVTIAQARLVQ